MTSGISVTFYALFESLGDFDYGEALIAVLENRNFEKSGIPETKKVKNFRMPPEVLGSLVWVRSYVKTVFYCQIEE